MKNHLALILVLLCCTNVYAGVDRHSFSDGVSVVTTHIDRRVGILGKDGKWKFPPVQLQNYYGYGFFRDGLAAVKINGQWGYLNRAGKVAIPFKFSQANPFSDGLAVVAVKEEGQDVSGVIDKTGKFVIPPHFNSIGSFKDGLMNFYNKDKQCGYMDRTGEIMIPAQFEACFKFNEGYAVIKNNEKYGLIDRTGQWVINDQFDHVSEVSEGLVVVKKNQQSAYFNTQGVRVSGWVEGGLGQFSEGLASIWINEKVGYINREFKIVINLQYNRANEFSEGMAVVEANGLCGYINRDGEVVIAPQFKLCHDFSDGYAVVTKDYTSSDYIDKSGKIVLDITELINQERSKFLADKANSLIAFRKKLGVGDETNCGPVIDVKANLVKVAFPVANYGNEHWIRRDQIMTTSYQCRFLNGQYQIPEVSE